MVKIQNVVRSISTCSFGWLDKKYVQTVDVHGGMLNLKSTVI